MSTNGLDFSRSGVGFTYRPAPRVDSVYPVGGPDIGGTIVTVTGAHLVDSPQLSCRFGTAVDDDGVDEAGALIGGAGGAGREDVTATDEGLEVEVKDRMSVLEWQMRPNNSTATAATAATTTTTTTTTRSAYSASDIRRFGDELALMNTWLKQWGDIKLHNAPSTLLALGLVPEPEVNETQLQLDR